MPVFGESVWNSAKSCVIISIEGRNVARFINLSTAEGICLSSIRYESPQKTCAKLPAKQFRRLRPIAVKCGCRLHIVKKSGPAFVLWAWCRRPGLLFGWIIVLIAVLLFSTRIGKIDVSGCNLLDKSEIVQAVNDFGIAVGNPIDKEKIALLPSVLMSEDERIAWAGVQLHGVRLLVDIEEASAPPNTNIETEPRSLYAKKSGLVIRAIAQEGKTCVTAGEAVTAGQLLISGSIGTDDNRIEVHARGTVTAQVLYDYTETVGPNIAKKILSGNSSVMNGCELFGILFMREAPYDECSIDSFERTELLRCFLPISFITTNAHELTESVQEGSVAELTERALSICENRMNAELSHDAKIISKDYDVIENDDGSVTVKLMVMVEENIAE